MIFTNSPMFNVLYYNFITTLFTVRYLDELTIINNNNNK